MGRLAGVVGQEPAEVLHCLIDRAESGEGECLGDFGRGSHLLHAENCVNLVTRQDAELHRDLAEPRMALALFVEDGIERTATEHSEAEGNRADRFLGLVQQSLDLLGIVCVDQVV